MGKGSSSRNVQLWRTIRRTLKRNSTDARTAPQVENQGLKSSEPSFIDRPKGANSHGDCQQTRITGFALYEMFHGHPDHIVIGFATNLGPFLVDEEDPPTERERG